MKSLKFLVVVLVVGFVLCAIAVAGVATYIVTSGPINLPGMPVNVATTPEAVKDLMNSGKPLKCTFESIDTEIGDQQWVLYKDDERIRGDSVVIDNDDATQTIHLINDGDYTYTWGDYKGQLVGTKYKLTEEDKMNANTSMEVLQNGELEDLLPEDYISTRCEIWAVDQEVFIPPSDVEAYLEAILFFYANPQSWQAASAAGKKASLEYTYEHYLHNVQKLFSSHWNINLTL